MESSFPHTIDQAAPGELAAIADVLETDLYSLSKHLEQRRDHVLGTLVRDLDLEREGPIDREEADKRYARAMRLHAAAQNALAAYDAIHSGV